MTGTQNGLHQTVVLLLGGTSRRGSAHQLLAEVAYDPGCMLVTCIESLAESKVPVILTFWPA
jgi:hypothetical protein